METKERQRRVLVPNKARTTRNKDERQHSKKIRNENTKTTQQHKTAQKNTTQNNTKITSYLEYSINRTSPVSGLTTFRICSMIFSGWGVW